MAISSQGCAVEHQRFGILLPAKPPGQQKRARSAGSNEKWLPIRWMVVLSINDFTTKSF